MAASPRHRYRHAGDGDGGAGAFHTSCGVAASPSSFPPCLRAPSSPPRAPGCSPLSEQNAQRPYSVRVRGAPTTCSWKCSTPDAFLWLYVRADLHHHRIFAWASPSADAVTSNAELMSVRGSEGEIKNHGVARSRGLFKMQEQ